MHHCPPLSEARPTHLSQNTSHYTPSANPWRSGSSLPQHILSLASVRPSSPPPPPSLSFSWLFKTGILYKYEVLRTFTVHSQQTAPDHEPRALQQMWVSSGLTGLNGLVYGSDHSWKCYGQVLSVALGLWFQPHAGLLLLLPIFNTAMKRVCCLVVL